MILSSIFLYFYYLFAWILRGSIFQRFVSNFCVLVYIWEKRILGWELWGMGLEGEEEGRGGRESWRAEGAKGGIQFENCGKRCPDPLQ